MPALVAKPCCIPQFHLLSSLEGGVSLPGKWGHHHPQKAVMGRERGSLSLAHGLLVEASVPRLAGLVQGGTFTGPKTLEPLELH